MRIADPAAHEEATVPVRNGQLQGAGDRRIGGGRGDRLEWCAQRRLECQSGGPDLPRRRERVFANREIGHRTATSREELGQ